VYVHDLPFLEYGHRLAKRHRVPLVFDTHEIYYEQDSLPASARRKLEQVERKRIHDVDVFLTVNEFIASWFQNRYPGVTAMSVHNALPGFPPPDRTVARARLEELTGFGPDDVIVLYQGWISAERNLDTMVAAMENVAPEVKLAVVGYGDHVEHLRTVAAAGREGAVCFLGRMEQVDLLAITPGADLGVIPYLPIDLNHELCSPNKFFEFVQNGVPVLAHRSPFFLAMSDRLGVVSTADLSTPASFGAALGELAAAPDTLRIMREACGVHRDLLAWEPSYAPVAERCRELLRASHPRE
jgi:glycosyltransferase involved in cell wall biosynthesis